MLTTPGGKPASLIRSAKKSAVSGVSSDGYKKFSMDREASIMVTLRTTVFPVAKAGASFAATTP